MASVRLHDDDDEIETSKRAFCLSQLKAAEPVAVLTTKNNK